MKKSRVFQLISGSIAIIAGVLEIIYQFNHIELLHTLFLSGFIIYAILFIVYFVCFNNK